MRYIFEIFRFGWPYMRRYWIAALIGVLFAMFYGMSNGAIVWGTKTILERLSENPPQHIAGAEGVTWLESTTFSLVDQWLPRVGRPIDAKQIIGGLCFLPLLVAMRGFSRFFSAWAMSSVSERVVNDLRYEVLVKLQSLSLDYFNRSTMGDLLMRIDGDTMALNRCFSSGFMDAVKEPFTMLGIVIALCAIDWQLTVCAVVLTPVCLLPVSYFGKRARKAAAASGVANISQKSLLVELLNGIRAVKALSLEDQQAQRYRGYQRQLIRSAVRTVKAKEQINPIVETLSMFGMGMLILYVFFAGRTTPQMVGFLTGMLFFFQPLKRLAGLHILLQESKFGVDRLRQVLSEEPTVVEKPNAPRLTQFTSEIRFRDVSFAYEKVPVLEELDLVLRAGEKVGIAGENGSGKSTLVNLLLRFYDPTAGSIEIDGVDLRDVRVSDLRGLIALVSQEVVIFDQTVAENIGCAKPGATREEIEEAAKAAGCHEFILQLPEGYDTRLGERGLRLSGGQRQRVSIARAFIRDAPIVILDEATASLDARAEADIQAAVDRLEEHRTVVCVAHRLSTLAAMDRVVVLAAGRVVEEGTFTHLLSNDGAFAAMARQQGLGFGAADPMPAELAPVGT